jgi:four helix bundle protein
MGVRRIEDLVAWQLARDFKRAVYQLVRAHPGATRDLPYRDQVFAAVSSVEANLVEGFHRYARGEFVRFLSIARGSLAEAQTWIRDGIDRGHFDEPACQQALTLGRRSGAAIAALQRALRALPSRRPPAPHSRT